MIYERRSSRPGYSPAGAGCAADDATIRHSGVTGWNRRHDAAARLVSLDCGCPDPWPCRCSEPPLSDRMIDGGRDAALHVLSVGQVPLLAAEILQALWRRGGADRELAELLHRMTEGQVA